MCRWSRFRSATVGRVILIISAKTVQSFAEQSTLIYSDIGTVRLTETKSVSQAGKATIAKRRSVDKGARDIATNPANVCVNMDSKPWQCLCYPGWGGQLCELDLDTCSTRHPCVNGGTCNPVRANQYRCICPEGYGGENCQIVVNPCVQRPCRNNGKCRRISNSTYTCHCEPGFVGQHCESNVDECLPNPCLNHGKCVDRVNSFECVCRDGFIGNRCENDLNECNSNVCRPSSTYKCINTVGSFKCLCNKGFIGTYCEINADDCASNPCLNDGKCVDQVSNYSLIIAAIFVYWKLINYKKCNSNQNDLNTHQVIKNNFGTSFSKQKIVNKLNDEQTV
ncbi:hypothetical protein B4U80_09429 [Leptotrombidium deliense]|uniref:EGF-like domain-containing protein n=1 Tax=Leptotrombidium deliense TaxID=299467 RepID=A0A443SJ36_9ACAR|nr:hypothetical protein B4U80_09429 [Leptotrombidium deliense]